VTVIRNEHGEDSIGVRDVNKTMKLAAVMIALLWISPTAVQCCSKASFTHAGIDVRAGRQQCLLIETRSKRENS
jgi:hypothetical protein